MDQSQSEFQTQFQSQGEFIEPQGPIDGLPNEILESCIQAVVSAAGFESCSVGQQEVEGGGGGPQILDLDSD